MMLWDRKTFIADTPYKILKRPYFYSNWGLNVALIQKTLIFVSVPRIKTYFEATLDAIICIRIGIDWEGLKRVYGIGSSAC